VCRHREGFVWAQGEVVAKALLAVIGETWWRWDVGWSDLGEGLRKEYEIVGSKEVVDDRAPYGDAAVEESVAVFSEGRSVNELVLAAGGAEGGVELLCELRPEVFVVVGVDPEHGGARVLAEIAVRSDEGWSVADVVVGD
jgi:hypothetical protein